MREGAALVRVAARRDAAAQAHRVDGVREDLRARRAIGRVVVRHRREEAREVPPVDGAQVLEVRRAVERVEFERAGLQRRRVGVDRQIEELDHREVVRAVDVLHGIDVAVPAARPDVARRVFEREAVARVLPEVAVVVEEREDGVALHEHRADLLQVGLRRARGDAAVELRVDAVRVEVRVEEHLGEVVVERRALRVAPAERHRDLHLVVGVVVDPRRAVVVALGRQEELRHEVPRRRRRERAVGALARVEVDQAGVGAAEREAVDAIDVAEDLAHEPERVQALVERARRLPGAAPRRLRDAAEVGRLRGRERVRPGQGPFGGLGERELERMDRLKPHERRLQLLAALRVVGGARLQRRRHLVVDALEALGEDRAERRHVVHVVAERPAAEREARPLARALAGEGRVGPPFTPASK